MKNTEFASYHPDIPALPQEIQDEVMRIVTQGDDIFAFKDNPYKNFGYFNVNEKIDQWCSQHFHFPFKAVVKTIDNYLNAHIDVEGDYSYNFIIEPGGDQVHTQWFSSLEPNAEILDDHVFPKQSWVKLVINKPHGVFGLEQGKKRVVLTVANQTKINREAYRHQRKHTQFTSGYPTESSN